MEKSGETFNSCRILIINFYDWMQYRKQREMQNVVGANIFNTLLNILLTEQFPKTVAVKNVLWLRELNRWAQRNCGHSQPETYQSEVKLPEKFQDSRNTQNSVGEPVKDAKWTGDLTQCSTRIQSPRFSRTFQSEILTILTTCGQLQNPSLDARSFTISQKKTLSEDRCSFDLISR